MGHGSARIYTEAISVNIHFITCAFRVCVNRMEYAVFFMPFCLLEFWIGTRTTYNVNIS